MRRLLLMVGAIVLVAIMAATVWARTNTRIVGGPNNDVLRGTAKADVLDGRRGNDTLLGRGGNDLLIGGPGSDRLVGGPGKDRLRCGPGKDVARADVADTVAADCEVVTGLPDEEPPPVEEPPPPPPPPAAAKPGRYCGFTRQGHPICVTVSPNSARVSAFSLSAEVDCGRAKRNFSFGTSGPAPIQSDLTFSHSVTGTLPDRQTLKNIVVSWEITGTFDTAGNVTGTFWFKRLEFDSVGTRWECSTSPSDFSARLGA